MNRKVSIFLLVSLFLFSFVSAIPAFPDVEIPAEFPGISENSFLTCGTNYTLGWSRSSCRVSDCTRRGYEYSDCETKKVWSRTYYREICSKQIQTDCVENPECPLGSSEIKSEFCSSSVLTCSKENVKRVGSRAYNNEDCGEGEFVRKYSKKRRWRSRKYYLVCNEDVQTACGETSCPTGYLEEKRESCSPEVLTCSQETTKRVSSSVYNNEDCGDGEFIKKFRKRRRFGRRKYYLTCSNEVQAVCGETSCPSGSTEIKREDC